MAMLNNQMVANFVQPCCPSEFCYDKKHQRKPYKPMHPCESMPMCQNHWDACRPHARRGCKKKKSVELCNPLESFDHELSTFILSFFFLFIHSFVHSFIHSVIHSFNHVILFQFTFPSSPRIPTSRLVPIAMFYFRNFRPGACWALPGI